MSVDLEMKPQGPQSSPFLCMVSRILLPICLIFSIHLLLRGHNFPGGGFIAGLLTAAVIGLQYIAFGIDWVDRRLPLNLYGFIVFGLSLALLTGVGSFFFEKPFLTSANQHIHLSVLGDFHLVTAFFFDLGVYFAVVGVVLSIFHLLGEEKPWK